MVDEFVVANQEHAIQMAGRIRKDDRVEIWQATRQTPLEALYESLELSIQAWAWVVDGEVAMILGVAPHAELPTVGVAWCLTTDFVDKYPKSFMKACHYWLPKLFGPYFEVLVNAIPVSYTKALRWAVHLGADVRPAQQLGFDGEWFHVVEFHKEAN